MCTCISCILHGNMCQHLMLLAVYMYFAGDYVSTFDVMGKKVLKVEPQALTLLAEQAMIDIAHLLRPGHLQVMFIKLWNIN